MATFFLFISDLFHQVLFYFGTVFAMGMLFIEKVIRPVSKKWFLAASLICLFVACYQSWLDEHRNTTTVIGEKAVEAGANNTCQSDLRAENTFASGQESLINSQRQSIDQSQQTIGKQQTAVNTCVVSLGKMNPIVRREVHVILIPFGIRTKTSTAFISRYASNPDKVYMEEIVITTNEDEVRASGYLRCDTAFELSGNPELPMISSGMLTTSPPQKISDREYRIEVSNTGSHWGPSTPIYFPIQSDSEMLGGCTFTPQ